jgi:hypothetical protein
MQLLAGVKVMIEDYLEEVLFVLEVDFGEFDGFGIDLPVPHGESVKNGVDLLENALVKLFVFIFEVFLEGFSIELDQIVANV